MEKPKQSLKRPAENSVFLYIVFAFTLVFRMKNLRRNDFLKDLYALYELLPQDLTKNLKHLLVNNQKTIRLSLLRSL